MPPSPESTHPPSHLAFIDALRGWAFLGVLLVHCGQPSENEAIRHWTLGGEYGVQLFFLLSALTLFRSLAFRRGEEHHPTRNYFLRRFFRIAPLFWFGIGLYYWLEGSGPRPVAPDGLHAWHYGLTATFLHGWAPTSFNSVVPGGWSIAVEMTFYLCLPFLFSRVTNAWRALVAAFGALVGGVFFSQAADFCLQKLSPGSDPALIAGMTTHWFPMQLPVFLLGAAVYFLWQNKRVSNFLQESALRPASLVAVTGYGLFALGNVDGGDFLPNHLLYALAFLPLILGLAARPFALFVNPFTRMVGTLSFSCYLTHFAALNVVAVLLDPDGGSLAPLAPPGSDWTRFLLTLAGTLGLTLLFSTATYWLIERPGVALGRYLIHFGEGPPARSCTSAPPG